MNTISTFKKNFTVIFFLVNTLFLANNAKSATATWTGGAGNGLWTTGSNWSGGSGSGGIPGIGDVVQFNNGGSAYIVTAVPALTINQLLVSGNTDVTLQAGSAIALSIKGSAGQKNLSVASGSTLRIGGGAGMLTLTYLGTGVTGQLGDIPGTLTLNANGTFSSSLSTQTITVEGTINLSSGSWLTANTATTISGTVNYNSSSGTITTTAATLTFSASSFYNHLVNGGAIPTATWDPASNCNITGMTATALSGLNQNFGNFTWNCSSQSVTANLGWKGLTIKGNVDIQNTGNSDVSLATGNPATVIIMGDLIVEGGILSMNDQSSSSNVTTLQLAGSYNQTGGTFQRGASSGTQVFNFINTSGKTFSLSPTGTTMTNTGINFTVNPGATIILNNDIAIPETFTNSGTLLCGTNIISGSGTFTNTAGVAVTLGLGDPFGITTSGATGNIQTISRNYNTGNNYIYNGSAAQATGNGLPAIINNLTINNTSVSSPAVILTNPSTTLAATGILTLTQGILLTTGTNILKVNNTAVSAVVGYSSASYIYGPLTRSFPANLPNGSTYAFPIGKSVYNLLELVNPTTNVTGTINAEAFDGSSGGTPPSGCILNSTRYWSATLSSSSFITSASFRLTEPANLVSPTNVFQSTTTANGSYTDIGGALVGQTVLSVPVTPSTTSNFLVLGAPCVSITLVTNPIVCQGATSANLPYSAITGTQYKITYDAAAHSAGTGFKDVTSWQTLTASPIVLSVPANAPFATYNGFITVTNDTCSSYFSFTVTVITPPAPGAITGASSICVNSQATLSSQVPTVTDGTITTSGGYRIHTFTSVTGGTFIIPAGFNASYDVLVVGGGGGGGSNGGGGGGAGGYIYSTGYSLSAGSYTVTVGAGGNGTSNSNVTGVTGGNSVFSSIIAKGGGGGASRDGGGNALSGGSGGGGGGGQIGAGNGTAGQGHAGGSGYTSSCASAGGGGGGANSVGTATAGTSQTGGRGGDGLTCPVTGLTYAGGGGGAPTCSGGYPGYTFGAGGTGGGGGGNGVAGTPNTGGGGGGGAGNGNDGPGAGPGTNGGKGGSGIVIVRYPVVTGVWSRSNMGVARVDSLTGVVTGIAVGTTTISYTVTVGSCTNVQTFPLTVINILPAAAGAITGTATVCQGQTGVTYSVPPISDATGYVWTLPTGAAMTAGTNTSSIIVSYSTSAGSGNVTVYGTNTCGNGIVSVSYPVTVNPLPAAADTISGTATVCQGQTGVTYSVPSINDATGYVWSLPTGAAITAGTNTSSITVSYSLSASSGNITVYGTDSCGNGTVSTNYSVTVIPLPAAADTISGTAIVCQGQTGVTYSIPAISNATGYVWSLPSGATITAGNNTNSITVSYSTSASSGNITVYGTNSICNGTVSANYSVTVITSPVITVTSPAVCLGTTSANLPYSATGSPDEYSITYDAAAHTAGFSDLPFTSLPASPVILTVPGTATRAIYNGIIKIKNNSSGCTGSQAFTVTVMALPPSPVPITGTSSICVNGTTTLSCNVPTGGAITTTTDGLYRINTFTSGGTFFALATGNVEVLVVAGGGGGGGHNGGGGGGGGLIYNTSFPVTAGNSYLVTVGAGGAGGKDNSSPGGNSVFSNLTATGGGGGKTYSYNGGTNCNGGSGGGGANDNNQASNVDIGGTAVSGQGYPGANACHSCYDAAGAGGGGAGGTGGSTNGTNHDTGGDGGNGFPCSISGSSVYYAGGGGGAGYGTSPGGHGGSGGGGHGGDKGGSTNCTAGQANTGGGGGGNNAGAGLSGGSGIVIVRSPNSPAGVWSSSNTGVVTVDASGNVIGISGGTATISYTITMGSCSTIQTFPLTVSSNSVPTIISVVPDTRCGAGTVNLQATASAGTVNWYDSGGNLLATGDSYFPVISSTTTFYVDATSNECTSSTRTAVLATRIPDNTPPASVNVDNNNYCAGAVNTITLTATGGCGQTLNWFAGSCRGAVIGTGSPLTISAPSTTTTYYASFTTDGSSGCTSVTVTVYDHIIITNPVNPPSICTGTGSASFSITAAGTELTYQWQLNKNDGNGWNDINSPGSNPVYSGWESPELQLAGIVVSDNGYQFRCILNDTICPHPVISSSASIIVGNSASIINQTLSQSRCEGDTVNLKIYTSGTPAPTYQWIKDGQIITNATLSSYFIPHTSVSDAGNYVCLVSNFCKSVISNPISFSISTPINVSFITGNKLKCVGDSALFIVVATGSPINYQWSKNSNPITGATTSNLKLETLNFGDAGTYSCNVSNICNSVNLNTSLSVNPALIIQNTIPDQTICQGNNVNFTVNATGTNLSYQWTKNSTPISGATLYSYLIPHASGSDAGTYSCKVSNECGIKSLTPFTLIVNAPPVFQLPASNFQLHVGDSIDIVCNVSAGTPPFTYQWIHDGNNIDNATTLNLKLETLNLGDSGLYSCKVTNICGNITAKIATLKVFNQGQYSVSGNVNYDNNAKTPMSNTTVYLYELITNNYELIDSAKTDNTGAYIFYNVPNADYKLTCKTTKARGGSNPLDALIVNRKFIGVYVITDPLRLKAADVNNDTKVNPLDALIINRRFIGSIKSFKIPDWLFETPSFTVNGANFTQNIKAICAGDVNGSYPSKYYDDILDVRY